MRLAVLRLLAAVLVFGLFAPSLTGASNAHEHKLGHSSVVVVLEAPQAHSDASPDGVCLTCHVNCGCHVGLPFSVSGRTVIAPPFSKIAAPISDHRRFSALTAPPNRPPRI